MSNEQKTTIFGIGQELFRQGEKGGELFFVKKGEIELRVRDSETGEDSVVAKVGPSSVLGTMSFMENDPRSATAKCISEVECIVINQSQREQLIKQIPSWFAVLVKDLSGNLRNLNNKFAHLEAENKLLEKKYLSLQKKYAALQDEADGTPADEGDKAAEPAEDQTGDAE